MKKIIILLTTLALLSFTNLVYAEIIGSGKIYYVVDGDTFDIQVDDIEVLKSLYRKNYVARKHINIEKNTFRVRLANTNTDESKHKDLSKNTASGRATSDAVKNRYSYKKIKFICYRKGKFDRAICDLKTSVENIAIWLIKNNHSDYITYFGKHPTEHKSYVLAERNSKQTGTNVANNNSMDFSELNKIKSFKKLNKTKVAKAAWDYFNKRKGVANVKKSNKLNMQDIANKLHELKQTSGSGDFLTEEQKGQLMYLKNLKY
jgi:endonuclease YncB( thermonuclease family)